MTPDKSAENARQLDELYSFGQEWLNSLEKDLQVRDEELCKLHILEDRWHKAGELSDMLAAIFGKDKNNG